MRTIHCSTRPDEFQLNIVGGNIIYAEWRDNIAETPQEQGGGFSADAWPVEGIRVPATRDEAIRLLMLCRYKDTSAECAVMRRPADDAERIEHEEYFAKVEAYVDPLGLS